MPSLGSFCICVCVCGRCCYRSMVKVPRTAMMKAVPRSSTALVLSGHTDETVRRTSVLQPSLSRASPTLSFRVSFPLSFSPVLSLYGVERAHSSTAVCATGVIALKTDGPQDFFFLGALSVIRDHGEKNYYYRHIRTTRLAPFSHPYAFQSFGSLHDAWNSLRQCWCKWGLQLLSA